MLHCDTFERSATPRRQEKGAAVVEFAIVTPLLLMVVFGIIAFGMLFAQNLSLNNAARQAARSGVIKGTTCAQINSLAKDSAATINMPSSAVQVKVFRGAAEPANWNATSNLCTTANNTMQPCTGQPKGTNLYVRLTYDSELIIPLFITDNHFNVTGKGVFRCEYS